MRGVGWSLVVLALATSPARAVVTGTIFGPGSASVAIAVVPLRDGGGDTGGALGAQFARVLTRDLDLSGYFKLVDPKTFIEDAIDGEADAGGDRLRRLGGARRAGAW